MMFSCRARLWLLAPLAASFACNVYDERLYKRARDAGMDHVDAAIDPNDPPGVPTQAADSCSMSAPRIETTGTAFLIDTSKLSNDTSATNCTGRAALGNDGYMRIDLKRGERWHFHVETEGAAQGQSSQNPSLYVRSACTDDRECLQGSDECADGVAEHFTFFAPADATYFVGVDDRGAGGGLYKLEAFSPVCGNGKREHGEACDPSEGTQGCSDDCRWELKAKVTEEHEVNDDPAFANRLTFEADGEKQIEIAGTLSGCPSADYFVFEVPEGASVSAQLLDANGAPCTEDPALELRLLDGERTRIALGSVQSDTGKCPIIDDRAPSSRGLSAGSYYVAITSRTGVVESEVPYRLRLSVN